MSADTPPPDSLGEPSSRPLVLIAIRLTWALILIVRPRTVLTLARCETSARFVAIARVLGARHIIQALVEVFWWPRWSTTGVVVDALHGSSAFLLAGLDRRMRVASVLDGLVASSFSVGGLAAKRGRAS